jgi:ketosteroid isomerase-like protein
MRGLVWLVLTITVASSSWAQMAPEAAIRELLQQQTMDWNRGNVDAFMKGYDDSPETTFVGQSVQYGYATIRDRYKKLYTTPEAMGKLTFRNLAIRIVDSGCAVATGNFHLERSTAGGGNADGIFSLVLKKEPLGWKIVLDHTSRTS